MTWQCTFFGAFSGLKCFQISCMPVVKTSFLLPGLILSPRFTKVVLTKIQSTWINWILYHYLPIYILCVCVSSRNTRRLQWRSPSIAGNRLRWLATLTSPAPSATFASLRSLPSTSSKVSCHTGLPHIQCAACSFSWMLFRINELLCPVIIFSSLQTAVLTSLRILYYTPSQLSLHSLFACKFFQTLIRLLPYGRPQPPSREHHWTQASRRSGARDALELAAVPLDLERCVDAVFVSGGIWDGSWDRRCDGVRRWQTMTTSVTWW